MIVYVYYDADHNDVQVFESLEDAKFYAMQNWPDEEEDWVDCEAGSYYGEYVTIYKKAVRGHTKVDRSPDEKLLGQSFCITGPLNSGKSRAELVEIIEANGGQVRKDVSADLTYLITDMPKSGSAKNRKADKYGVPKITEEEFEKLI